VSKTAAALAGHSPGDVSVASSVLALAPLAPARAAPLDFDQIYEANFSFVWRNLVRLGVREAHVEDAAQDVFLVVHRRLGDFEGRSSVRTWLFGIVLRVANDHRRRARRKGTEPLPDVLPDATSPGPFEGAARTEATRLLARLLEELPEERRAVFVLAEVEGMTAPEIGEALGVNVNTVSTRLRAARMDFERAVRRHAGREETP
jgi:RNA polymerase sigma-70 factor, ECF subfamily